MSFQQMNQYDKFKEECEGDYSYLKSVDLLEVFMSEKGKSPCFIEKFGSTYLRFHETEMYELIEWIFEKRKNYHQNAGL